MAFAPGDYTAERLIGCKEKFLSKFTSYFVDFHQRNDALQESLQVSGIPAKFGKGFLPEPGLYSPFYALRPSVWFAFKFVQSEASPGKAGEHLRSN